MEQLIQTCDQVMEAHQDWILAYRKAKQLRTATLKGQAEMACTCFQLGIFVLTYTASDLELARVVGRSISMSSRFEEEEDLFQGGFECTDLGWGQRRRRIMFMKNNKWPVQKKFT